MSKTRHELSRYIIRTLSDGEVHYVEYMAEEFYGEDTFNNVTSIRMGIARLRQEGYIIESPPRPGSRRKKGYRFADTSENWEKGFSNGRINDGTGHGEGVAGASGEPGAVVHHE